MKKLKKYIGFGVGALGLDLSYGMFYSFLNKYLTDIALIPKGYLAAMAFAARVWDGFNDPMMGAVVDATKSRYGKYRPWLVIGAVFNAAVLMLLFWNPGFQTTAAGAGLGLIVYVTIFYVLWGMTNTLVDIPYWSMVPLLTNDPKERNIAATAPRAFSGLGQLIVTIAAPVMIPLLGRGEGLNALGFQRWAMVCGIGLISFVLITFFSTGNIKEVAGGHEPQYKVTFKSVAQTIKGNDQLLVFMLVALLLNTGWYLVSSLAVYYFEDVAGNLKLMSLFGMLVGAGQAAGLVLLPVLTKWMRRNTIIKLAMGMCIFGYLAMYFFSAVVNSFALFAICGVICMMGVGCCFVSQTVMLSDIVDYGEAKLGYRADSVVFSMKGFLQKGAYSIQSLIMFLGLQITGYRGELSAQPDSAKTGITVMMFLLPPIFALAALLLFGSKYKLNEERMREVQTQLEGRKKPWSGINSITAGCFVFDKERGAVL